MYLIGASSYANFVGFLPFVLRALDVPLEHTFIAWLLARRSTFLSLKGRTPGLHSFNPGVSFLFSREKCRKRDETFVLLRRK
jgi:hypothetical protein